MVNARGVTVIVENTPFETHTLNNVPIWVKREDLCCPAPGPSFSKMRGVIAHISKRPEKTIGVLDTLHSKAGWAVSWACQQLGKQAVNYWPRFAADPREGLVREQQKIAASMGAITVSLAAGRSAILFHSASKHLRNTFPDSYMMPNALKLAESVQETSEEVSRGWKQLPDTGTLIISISSGTIASGVIKGWSEIEDMNGNFLSDNWTTLLHLGYSRSLDAVQEYIESRVGRKLPQLKYIDEGYGYADAVDIEVPFPCNPHYDAKAWYWLSKQSEAYLLSLPQPIVFWNIGA